MSERNAVNKARAKFTNGTLNDVRKDPTSCAIWEGGGTTSWAHAERVIKELCAGYNRLDAKYQTVQVENIKLKGELEDVTYAAEDAAEKAEKRYKALELDANQRQKALIDEKAERETELREEFEQEREKLLAAERNREKTEAGHQKKLREEFEQERKELLVFQRDQKKNDETYEKMMRSKEKEIHRLKEELSHHIVIRS